ncbi:hypothetical protein LINGRAHAP2_LOCUS1863, partial [Linum grandiflorum]
MSANSVAYSRRLQWTTGSIVLVAEKTGKAPSRGELYAETRTRLDG